MSKQVIVVGSGNAAICAGLKVDDAGAVLDRAGAPIAGLYACGERVGGVFYNGYPGGSGLTSGAVFGRQAGYGAARS